jgi:hypothetical protein
MIISFPCKDVLRRLLLCLDFSIFLMGIFSEGSVNFCYSDVEILYSSETADCFFFQPLFKSLCIERLALFCKMWSKKNVLTGGNI